MKKQHISFVDLLVYYQGGRFDWGAACILGIVWPLRRRLQNRQNGFSMEGKQTFIHWMTMSENPPGYASSFDWSKLDTSTCISSTMTNSSSSEVLNLSSQSYTMERPRLLINKTAFKPKLLATTQSSELQTISHTYSQEKMGSAQTIYQCKIFVFIFSSETISQYLKSCSV